MISAFCAKTLSERDIGSARSSSGIGLQNSFTITREMKSAYFDGSLRKRNTLKAFLRKAQFFMNRSL